MENFEADKGGIFKAVKALEIKKGESLGVFGNDGVSGVWDPRGMVFGPAFFLEKLLSGSLFWKESSAMRA
jgi:hypothetical protein